MTIEEIFSDFRNSKRYEERKEQTKFASLARELILEKLSMDKLTKLDLTGFIQMFAWRGDNEDIFNKYYKLLGFNPGNRERCLNLIINHGAGYTAVGKTANNKLTSKNAAAVKTLLIGISNVQSVEIAKTIVDDYEKLDIPEVKAGVFSPWLHYLQPTICPIVNGPTKKHLYKLGWDGTYSHAIELFQRIARDTGEKDLGIIDSMFWSNSIAKKLVGYYKKSEKVSQKRKRVNIMSKHFQYPLNTILYGPPGTGKTFNTINKALEIIHNDPSYCENKNRKELVKEFNEIKDTGQIEFITFHQSYHYEDFIEGIRPYTENDLVKYKVEDGVFKKTADRANLELSLPDIASNIDFSKVDVYKMSLGDTTKSEEASVFEFCMANNCIALGWGDNNDFTSVPSTRDWDKSREAISKIYANPTTKYGIQAVYYFKNLIRLNDLVFISYGNSKIRAIGRVLGEYEYRKETEIGFHHFRKVQWLIKDADIDSDNLYGKNLSQQSIYQFNKKHLFVDRIQRLLGKEKDTPNNYVLIIDEINRGNISKIFGEIITLLEEDKRLGAINELKVRLPYSGKQFGVPNNLFIIGTMNTADRSTALVDIALRRRFSFIPLYPEYNVVKDKVLKALLENLNINILKELGPDYQIGHSFFINKSEKDLNDLMNNKVLPLLNEYYYGDNEKILNIFTNTSIEKRIQLETVSGQKIAKSRLLFQ